MIQIADRSVSIMIMFAVCLHLVWGGILLFDHSATDATAVHALSRYVANPPLLTGIIFLAAALAMLAIAARPQWTLLLLLPQQILLMMSAAGCVEAIYTAQFADGVARSRAFIAADQAYSVLAAIGHTIAIIRHAAHRQD